MTKTSGVVEASTLHVTEVFVSHRKARLTVHGGRLPAELPVQALLGPLQPVAPGDHEERLGTIPARAGRSRSRCGAPSIAGPSSRVRGAGGRGPEQRTNKRPLLSDLRDSGALEDNADLAVLLHREDTYDKESPRAGEADLIVAKHRNGPTATITSPSKATTRASGTWRRRKRSRAGNIRSGRHCCTDRGTGVARWEQGHPPRQDPGPGVAVLPPRTRTKTFSAGGLVHD